MDGRCRDPWICSSRQWERPSSVSSERGIQYVLEMRSHLEKYHEEKVLLLLSSTSKLLAKWQGPFTMERKLGPTTYEKCEWTKAETRYLGYQLGRGEIRPQVDKVEAITRTKTQVRSFLGLVGWYQFTTIAAPLTNLTAKVASNTVKWTKECESAFRALKSQFCSSPVLQSPHFQQRFLVPVDASGVGIGAVLAQGDPGEERPVLYLSRKLLPRETWYSAIEKECLAIKWALDSLRYYLWGRGFDLHMDQHMDRR
ncbi:hypothetical protein SKAU_G00423050 [Synaphobranchus kaupii]|uniref:Reverse transcriptase/retrotransposon-derived protein RNase H-like domain-containing protein n=1 Tax=Synaphobranchus kaupii TaxID=118154 RepID=A0A9Q1E5A3_SYNKA|nr:hypothetical protein SKAU_G00423050 [Synaphobranchus kaupii]